MKFKDIMPCASDQCGSAKIYSVLERKLTCQWLAWDEWCPSMGSFNFSNLKRLKSKGRKDQKNLVFTTSSSTKLVIQNKYNKTRVFIMLTDLHFKVLSENIMFRITLINIKL